MMSAVSRQSSESPFDAIRHTREDGSDFWSARELMPLLEYAAWRNFEVPLLRAQTTAINQGLDVAANFVGSRKVTASGPDAVDFELSREAAYLVAMNGDPNKAAVAAAQAYFVVRTREAETQAAPAELAMPSHSEALRGWAREIDAREAAEEYVRELTPKAEYVDNFVSHDDLTEVRVAANNLGIRETALRELLLARKWAYRKFICRRWSKSAKRLVDEHEWRPYADKSRYFRVVAQHKVARHHNNQLRRTMYVTPEGMVALRRLVAGLPEEAGFEFSPPIGQLS